MGLPQGVTATILKEMLEQDNIRDKQQHIDRAADAASSKPRGVVSVASEIDAVATRGATPAKRVKLEHPTDDVAVKKERDEHHTAAPTAAVAAAPLLLTEAQPFTSARWVALVNSKTNAPRPVSTTHGVHGVLELGHTTGLQLIRDPALRCPGVRIPLKVQLQIADERGRGSSSSSGAKQLRTECGARISVIKGPEHERYTVLNIACLLHPFVGTHELAAVRWAGAAPTAATAAGVADARQSPFTLQLKLEALPGASGDGSIDGGVKRKGQKSAKKQRRSSGPLADTAAAAAAGSDDDDGEGGGVGDEMEEDGLLIDSEDEEMQDATSPWLSLVSCARWQRMLCACAGAWVGFEGVATFARKRKLCSSLTTTTTSPTTSPTAQVSSRPRVITITHFNYGIKLGNALMQQLLPGTLLPLTKPLPIPLQFVMDGKVLSQDLLDSAITTYTDANRIRHVITGGLKETLRPLLGERYCLIGVRWAPAAGGGAAAGGRRQAMQIKIKQLQSAKQGSGGAGAAGGNGASTSQVAAPDGGPAQGMKRVADAADTEDARPAKKRRLVEVAAAGVQQAGGSRGDDGCVKTVLPVTVAEPWEALGYLNVLALEVDADAEVLETVSEAFAKLTAGDARDKRFVTVRLRRGGGGGWEQVGDGYRLPLY